MQISECQFELEQFWEIVIVCKKEKKLSAQNEINTWQAAQPESKDNGEFVDVDTRLKLTCASAETLSQESALSHGIRTEVEGT